jgi:hypothetical protein
VYYFEHRGQELWYVLTKSQKKKEEKEGGEKKKGKKLIPCSLDATAENGTFGIGRLINHSVNGK